MCSFHQAYAIWSLHRCSWHSACRSASINLVLAIVRTLAACPAPLSCRNELLAVTSGLSLRRSLDLWTATGTPAAPERRQKLATGLFLAFLQRVKAFSQLDTPSVVEGQPGTSSIMSSNSWAWCSTLPCCSFAFPAESTTSMPAVSDLCTTRIDFEPAWSHVWSQPSISQQSLEMFLCHCLRTWNHSVHRASFTDHMRSFHPFTWFQSCKFLFVHGNTFERGWTSHVDDMSRHTRVFGSFARRAFEVSGSLQGVCCVACACRR